MHVATAGFRPAHLVSVAKPMAENIVEKTSAGGPGFIR
jgi:hypothetical protein